MMLKHAEPTRMGRYELLTMLGEGGMARVYLAVNRGPVGFNKLVVVKQVRPELAWDREFLTMFFDEARIAARLNHPNVVQTYEVLEDTGQYLLAMEFLEGHTLSEVLRRVGRANMPLEEHLWVLTQVLAGLHYAHELCDFDGTPLGVVHRDVSPSNVFITYNGEVKLLDFGIAKAAGAISATQKGMVKGKLGYGAPEQFAGEYVDRRADIHSVGIMLWEALARQRRKLADTPAATFLALVGGAQPKVREVEPNAPPDLAVICDKAVATDPVDRYASAAEFLADLESYLEKHMRRVDRRDLCTLLAQYFKGDRQEMSRLIEDQLGTLRGPTSESRQSISPSRAPTVVDVARQQIASGFPANGAVDEPWWSHNRRYLMAGVALALIVLVAVVSRMRAKAKANAAAAAPVVAAMTSKVSEPKPLPAPPVADDRSRAGAADTIRFSIRVEPPSATLVLDGKKLGTNPFQAEVQREPRGSHLLRATAPGYSPVERTINFARDINVIVSLRPGPAALAAPASRAPKRADDDAPAPRAERAEPKEIEPGVDLRQEGPRSGRRIDEKDPYAK
jgi:serine/threonine-protein kinase